MYENNMIYPISDAEASIEDLATMHSFGTPTLQALEHLAASDPHYTDEAYEDETCPWCAFEDSVECDPYCQECMERAVAIDAGY